jgi:hypothetical protein
MPLIALRPRHDTLRLVAALGGTWHGFNAMCRCPVHADHTPSLSIRQGERGLLVTCFAGCDAVTVLLALRHIEPGKLPAALPLQALPGKANATETACRIWDQGLPIAGTLAERYLASRYLPPELPDIRFHPKCPFGKKPDTVFMPALLIAARDNVELRGIQRIILNPDGTAGVKATLGSLGQAAWRPWQSDPGILAVGEGFATAAAYTQLTGVTCWASFGARRLPLIELPDTISKLIIAQDNDAEGRLAGMKAREAYFRQGLVVIKDRPRKAGYDWADVLARHEERGCGTSVVA